MLLPESGSHYFCFNIFIYSFVSRYLKLLCNDNIRTDNSSGYALPIRNGVHMCIFRKTFFRDKNDKCSIFYKILLEVFHSDGGGGVGQTTSSAASSHMRSSVACNVFTMYIVFFLKDVCKKNTYFVACKKQKAHDVTDLNTVERWFDD